jgi:hypothetical protein
MVSKDLPNWRRFFSLFKKGLSFEEIRTALSESNSEKESKQEKKPQ